VLKPAPIRKKGLRRLEMRAPRRIFALPLLILGLLFQVGAPVGAARAAAAMADPFAQIVICSPDKDKTGPQGEQQAPARHDGHLCGQCAVCWSAGSALAGDVQALAAPRPAGAVRPRPVSETPSRGPPGRLRPPTTGPPPTI
jgi:hypothetical protein